MNRSDEGQGGRLRRAGPGVAGSARRWLGGAFIAVALSVAGCDSLLDVELPGNISAETLNDPRFAALLATSAQGDFECAFNSYVWWSAYWTNDTHPANITRTNQIVHLRDVAVKTVASLGSAGAQPN